MAGQLASLPLYGRADDWLEKWPDRVKAQQREWIGRSEGAEIRFPLAEGDGAITVFTTRPDTLWGATFMVLAPEHALVESITTPDRRAAVDAYRQDAASKRLNGTGQWLM